MAHLSLHFKLHSMPEFVHTAEIVKMIPESESVKRFILKPQTANPIAFKAGQFIVISFPTIDHMFPYRSYSIASSPHQSHIEICVVLKPDGAATPELFAMQPGDKLEFTAPLGSFVLPEDLHEKELFLICTGTGIAPFRSMIQDIVERSVPIKKITLIFGCRTQQDLLYRKEWEALEKTMPQFSYIPALSRESWDGLQGYVHQAYLNKPELMHNPNALFYICGWTQMVKEAKNNLKQMGYKRNQIKFELYD